MRGKAVDGVGDVMVFQQPFRLQIIEMKPYAARIVALPEIDALDRLGGAGGGRSRFPPYCADGARDERHGPLPRLLRLD